MIQELIIIIVGIIILLSLIGNIFITIKIIKALRYIKKQNKNK